MTSRLDDYPWLKYVVLGVALAVAAVAVLLVSRQSAPPPTEAKDPASTPSTSAAVSTPAGPKRMVVIGDSFMEGEGAKSPETGMAQLIADDLGYDLTNLASGGTGYLNPGPKDFDRVVFEKHVPEVVAADPDVVLVAGGINDWELFNKDAAKGAQTIRDTLTELVEAVPDAKVYVVGPFWPNGFPVPGVVEVDAAVRGAADDLGLTFIDPIKGKWITGDKGEAKYIGADNTHPTPAGHEYLAGRIVEGIDPGR